MQDINKENLKIARRKNVLLRYQKIKELYNQTVKNNPYIPVTSIYRAYIYPVYPISKTTLYTILCTAITSELKQIDEIYKKQATNNKN